MAQFGVTTALTSIMLSVFMAGLGLGSWIVGTMLRRYGHARFRPLRLYALLELLIGISAFVVPMELAWGHNFLTHLATGMAVSSGAYYLISGIWLAAAIIPASACMGATLPVAMFAIRSDYRLQTSRSFSFLYVANVLGAMGGSFLPLLAIEFLGFSGTLHIGALLNATIAVCALLMSSASQIENRFVEEPQPRAHAGANERFGVLGLLFTTGLVTMGTELIWIRLFTPFIGPVVYTFGLILVAYLLGTTIGARVYRGWSQTHTQESRLVWISLAFFGILPLLTADSRLPIHLAVRVFVGVMPFAGAIGFLTPSLVDRWSAGDPDRAGLAYAVNVVGCIGGPLLAGFLLLPWAGEHVSLLLLVLPWFAMAWPRRGADSLSPALRVSAFALLAAALAIFFGTQSFEIQFPDRLVLRDSVATVVATGRGMDKQLLVNGIGMTKLTPITKMMAHLTLASLDHEPRRALVICFGMGTTFRSAITWGVSSTVVELVPSVPKLFTYFHPDGDKVEASPLARIVVDDGRRFLERSPEFFDVIIIDPPPPLQTAGSSLLYSQEFYAVAKRRLRSNGILQQWLPGGDDVTRASVARALRNSFPYVRVFRGVEGWGWHFLASESPIPLRTSAGLLARMPESAIRDMMEWGPASSPERQFDLLLSHESSVETVMAPSPRTPPLQDDHPLNEFYLLRLSL